MEERRYTQKEIDEAKKVVRDQLNRGFSKGAALLDGSLYNASEIERAGSVYALYMSCKDIVKAGINAKDEEQLYRDLAVRLLNSRKNE